MNATEVKKLLEESYGQPRTNLTLDGKKSTNSIYYYILPNEEEVRHIRDTLNGGSTCCTNDLLQSYAPPARGTYSEVQCACFTEREGEWSVSFHEIQGIRYHNSYGKHLAATVMLRKPIFTLSSDTRPEFFYGFWGRNAYKNQTMDGMLYFVNKNIYSNRSFRTFSAAFFRREADLTGLYILKDIAKTIEKHGFFLMDASFSEIKAAHTPKELLKNHLPDSAVLEVNLNTLDLNLAYLSAVLAGIVPPQDRKYILRASDEMVESSFSLNALYEGLRPERVISAYYRHALQDEFADDEEIAGYARDYAKLCLDNELEVRLSYSTFDSLVRAHNEASRIDRQKNMEIELNAPLITVPSQFDDLEKQLEASYPGAFERIKDTRRLLREGEEQHNCCFGRRTLLRADKAAIFHWDYQSKQYTVQFGVNNAGYYVEEIKAKYNEPCEPPAMSFLHDFLNGRQPLL